MTVRGILRWRALKGTAMILVHSWESLQTTFPTRALEWFLTFALFNLGVIFWLTPDLFASNVGWAGMANLADQSTWCAVCLIVGVARILALVINGLWWRSPLVRCVGAFISCFVWWQLSAGLIGNAGLGAAVLPLCFVGDVYNAIRCSRKSGVSEYVKRLELQAEARHGHNRHSANT